MNPQLPLLSPRGCNRKTSAFTLVEMLVVIAIMLVIMALAIPAFNAIKGGSDVTKAAYDVVGALETAATYARTANTYVWIGFYEENGATSSTTPPTPGIGRLVIATVYSNDGTQIIDPASSGQTIAASRLTQMGKLIKINNMHFGDISAPGSPNAKGEKTIWDQRPSVINNGTAYRIGATTPNNTSFPFTAGQYTFYKTIQFSPQGVAVMNSGQAIVPWLEVGLQPAHGNVPDTVTPNVAAVQVAGINPQVRIYRK